MAELYGLDLSKLRDCSIAPGKPSAHLGYCYKRFRGHTDYAHRVSYVQAYGEIPKGHEIHHLCHERRCIEPTHLVSLSKAEHLLAHNTRERFIEINAARSSQTHCPKGHEYITYGFSRRRRCRECSNKKSLEIYYRKKGVK
jgi:hypothetical protein